MLQHRRHEKFMQLTKGGGVPGPQYQDRDEEAHTSTALHVRMKSVAGHIRRMANARRYGIDFVRRRNFAVPAHIRIGSRRVAISYPAEDGVRNDFLTCFLDDEYGLRHVRGPVRTVLDIGSNVGFFAMSARARFPEAIVHAYEPNPRILPFLKANTAECRVEVFADAVGDRDGIVNVIVSGDSNQTRVSTSAGISEESAALVPLSTAVRRLGGLVDVAKIDAEGAEWEMFSDATAWKGIRQVRMEYHLWGQRSYPEVAASLDKLDFDIEHHVASGEWGTVWALHRGPPPTLA
jgi:FkbM family methyltransferase